MDDFDGCTLRKLAISSVPFFRMKDIGPSFALYCYRELLLLISEYETELLTIALEYLEEKKWAQAFPWFTLSWTHDKEPVAAYHMAIAYLWEMNAVKRDTEKATNLLREAVKRGYPRAKSLYAQMIWRKWCDPLHDNNSDRFQICLPLWQEEADEFAQWSLANRYALGYVCFQRNIPKALELWQKALPSLQAGAAKGDIRALEYLMNAHLCVVPYSPIIQDPERVDYYFRLAEQLGFSYPFPGQKPWIDNGSPSSIRPRF